MGYGYARRAAALVVAAVAGLGIAGSAAAQTFTARIGNCTINDAIHEHIKIIKDELERQSGGRIKGELYINCQLGTIARQIEGLQLGTQDFFTVPPGNAVGTEPRYQVIDAPGQFDNFEHAQAAVTHPVFYDKYMQLGRDKGIVPVSLWQAASASYLSLMPLRTIDDFKGRKIRVIASKIETELMSRSGATGVPIPYTEIVPSLISRMVDAARTGPIVIASAKMYTAAKYLTLTGDTYVPILTWASALFLDKLPPDLKAVVFKVGRDVEARMLPLALGDHERALTLVKENGVEIINLPPDQQAEWMRRARAVADGYFGADPTMRDLYAALQDAAQKTRK